MRISRTVAGLAIAALAFTGQSAKAAFLPSGVQTNVSFNTVTATWGWTLAYSGDYGLFDVSTATFLPGTEAYVMLAGRQTGSDTIDVLAATTRTVVTTFTPTNTTINSNGSEWYFNGLSMGFAPGGSTIQQNSADINGSTLAGPTNDPDRLSWHAGTGTGGFGFDGTVPLSFLAGGWRSGSNIFLNGPGATGWERLVFVAVNADPPGAATPLPATAVGLLLGAAGLAGVRLRRRTIA